MGPAEIPDLPSLDELAQEYDAPTAQLDQENVRETVDSVPQLESLLAAFRSTDAVLKRAETAKEPADERTNEGIQLRGSLQVTLRCPGQVERPEYDEERNGQVLLTMAVSRSRILRNVNGQASSCRIDTMLGPVPLAIALEGDVDLDIGADLPLGGTWPRVPWLVALRGSLSIENVTFNGVSARISAEGVEYLQRLSDGTSVIMSAGPSAISVRGRDATWSCNNMGGPCEQR